MDIQEILNLADHLIFNKTGKHLEDLQQAILRGVFQGKKIFRNSPRMSMH